MVAEVQNIKTRGLWLISIEFLEEKEDYRFKTLATDRPLFSNSSPSCKICLLRFPLPSGNSAEGFLRQYYFRNLESFKIISIKTEQPLLFLDTCQAQ